MSFEKIKILRSKPVILPVDNIDTDQIIPARFLKSITREGIGSKLFYDWRYNKDGSVNSHFVFNRSDPDKRILAAGENFGCGSSREHAAWALYDYGIRAVISTSFADIFKGNALNNGLLPVQVTSGFMKKIFESGEQELQIDLQNKTLFLAGTGEFEFFEIDSYKQNCLINGYEDIDYLLSHMALMEEYEKKHVII
jgi:3-isopropylmalate/(R)-2-methylmalate dehydratase small subunit